MYIWYRRDSGLEALISRIQSEGKDTEGMTVPGVALKIGSKVKWGNIYGSIADQTDLKAILDELQRKIEEGIVSGKVFVYKGQVPTYNDLPNNAKAGDVWDVADTGYNYVWSGESWDNLSSSVDLSEYAKIDDVTELINQTVISIQTELQSLDDKKADTTYVIELNNSVVDGVNAEINARKAADITLQNNIDKVAEDLQRHIDEGEGNFVTREEFNQEVTDRQAADEALDTRIDTLQEIVDDTLAHQDGNIQNLLLQMDTLEKKIEDLKSLDYEVVTFYDGGETKYNNPIKDFQLSGAIASPAIITSNSVTLKESTMAATYMDLYADNDITVKQSTFNGSVPKATSNAIMKLRANGYITVRDYTFTIEKAYNAIECNLSEAIAKSIVIDNVNFDGPLSNNAINIFGMANGGVVTIASCHFKKVSNMLRISNRLNTNWTINIINCTVDEWDVGQYSGAILLQDYVSKSTEEVATRNEFKNLTINIQNLTKPDGTKVVPCDLSTICGTQDNNQLIYVYDSYNGVRSYNETIYPTINIQ